MLKTLSAALVAASMIAAPAFAETAAKTKTTQSPVIKADQTKSKATAKTDSSPAIRAEAKADTKSKALDANASSVHHKQVRHRYRHHHKMTSLKARSKVVKAQSKMMAKQPAPVNARKSG